MPDAWEPGTDEPDGEDPEVGPTGNRVTAFSGDAVTSSERRRPAQRQAAHEASSINSGSGPQPVTLATGLNTSPSTGVTG
jgi:hypothetical protein